MPTYCFSTEDGLVIDRTFPMGQAPGSIKLQNGQVAKRDFRAEHVSGTVVGSDNPVKRRPGRPWPMPPCYASGVHASQAGELREHLANRGVPTEVTIDGDPIYTSAVHRKKALKARGLFDRASFN